jgi:hypothetical protein
MPPRLKRFAMVDMTVSFRHSRNVRGRVENPVPLGIIRIKSGFRVALPSLRHYDTDLAKDSYLYVPAVGKNGRSSGQCSRLG